MKIGAHESIAGGVANALDRAVSDGCESVQLFARSPNRWTSAPLTAKDTNAFKDKLKIFDRNNITSHAAYLINLASPKEDTYEKSISCITDEMERCNQLEIPFYVLHPGSPLSDDIEAGISKIAKSIDHVYSSNALDVMLLLEVTAGTGYNIGDKFEHIESIIQQSKYKDKVGVCLDSCHLYSAGYDIVNNYASVMDEVFQRFGDKVKVFHLNDSKNPMGSKKDRHELIGKGSIGIDFFKTVVNDKRFSNVLGVLETPISEDDSYMEEIRLLKSFRV